MKKIFKIPKQRNGFLIRIQDPLVGNDINSYVIQWEFEEDMTGAQMVVSAKREDGEVISDSVEVDGKVAKYILKNNMYCVSGEVNIRVQIVKDETMLTQCQLVFDVLDGYEQNVEGNNDVPILSSLILQAQEAINAAKEIANTIPELDYADIDKMGTPKGIYKLVNIPSNETNVEKDENNKDELIPSEELLIISDCYDYYVDSFGEDEWEDGVLQVRYRGDGTILKRWTYCGEESHRGIWHIVSSTVQTATTAIPTLDYTKIDDKALSKGIYKLVNIPRSASGHKTGDGKYYYGDETISTYTTEELLFVSDYTVAEGTNSAEDGILQVRYCGDGTILRRLCWDNGDTWGSWESYSESSSGPEVIDNLESDSSTSALSANMGRELNEKISSIEYSITELDYADIDNAPVKGIYKLINVPAREIDLISDASVGKTFDIYLHTDLLFVSDIAINIDDVIDEGKLQVRYCADGTILQRYKPFYGEDWSEWIKRSFKSEMNFKGKLDSWNGSFEHGDVVMFPSGEVEGAYDFNIYDADTDTFEIIYSEATIDGKIGNIETALDEIITIQNTLIGGDSE